MKRALLAATIGIALVPAQAAMKAAAGDLA